MAVSPLEGEYVCVQIPLVSSVNLDARCRHYSCSAPVAFYGWPLISANTSHKDETSVYVCLSVCVSVQVYAYP